MRMLSRFSWPIVGLAALLLSGCAGFVVQTRAYPYADTVVVGETRLVATGFPDDYYSTVVLTGGIHLTFRNVDTGQTFVVVTGPDGYFELQNVPPGPYVLVHYEVEHWRRDGRIYAVSYIPPERLRFVVSRGVVRNLGVITWHRDNRGHREWQDFGNGYERVHRYYRVTRPRVGWIRLRWIVVD